ncbi:MAG: protein-S-isoprenylcysteine methyltransferase [Acidobacteria bacterium]|nr:MAG: protein-S-isoprenylcysteine methyltransferase [Acidobacteriota bacterium]
MLFDLPELFSRIRVPVGFLLAGFYFFFSRPTWRSLLIGGTIAFLGLLLRAWATGHLRKNDELAVTGPYAFTRNPLYLGSFLIGVGFSLAGADPLVLVVFLASFATLYGPVMQKEMDHVRKLFTEEYAEYQKRVPLFFPCLWPRQRPTGSFSFQRYLENREHQALLGFLVAIGLLVLKIQYC